MPIHLKKGFYISILLILVLYLSQACSPVFHPAKSRLDAIVNTGILRVGTTGDYPPFTYLDSLSGYQGIDIELARDLAQSLEVEVQFVRTTWTNLLADLAADKFDIAMGGISRKIHRQRIGLLTVGYAVGGKTPIARCEDRDRLSSLAQIDRPEVTLIVNPGGTNEMFVKEHIKNAKVIVYPDNTTIFQQIIDKKADVMITDSHEVMLQTKLRLTLCPTMPDQTFDRSEKAYLLPRDLIWKEYVNTWLEVRHTEGLIEKTLFRYLGKVQR